MSKKKLIAIITIIVLLFAAGISVGVFLYGRGETEAADGSQTNDQGQVTDGNQTTGGTQTGDNPTTDVQNPGEEDTTTPGEEVDGAVDNETVENDNQNAENNAANNNNVANNQGNAGNNGNNAGVTTDTNVGNVGETTITRVEEQERLVSEDFLDWWKPMTVSVKPTEVGVELPQITVEKTAITGVGGDKLVYIGQDITYVIAVTNNSKTAVENIEISDRIPENTTYVADSIEEPVILRKVDGKLTSEVVGTKTTVEVDNNVVGVKWIASIPAGETVIARFTVNVNKTMLDANQVEIETTGTILNSAIANGEESNEVKNPIIRTHKSSEIARLNEETQEYETVETAKIGDLITYTISIENTGNIEGSTYVIDAVPAGTQFVSAQEGAMVTKSVDTSITWSVTIPAHTIITREFTVEVTSVEGLIKNVADVGGTPTNEDVIDTANIDVIKTATAVKRAGEEEFTTPVGEVKENDVIQYTIVVTNTGSRDLTNVLLEEQLEGVEVTKLVVDNVEKTIEKDVETGKLFIGDLKAQKEATEESEAVEAGVAVITAEYVVTYDVDIKGKGNEDGTIIPIYNKVIATGETIPDPENPEEVPEKVEDNDDETVPVAQDPRFEIVKTAVEVKRVREDEFSAISGKVRPGDIVKYEIVVTNTGNTKLTNIVVTDTLTVRIDTENGELKEVNQETGVSTLKTIPSLVAGAKETIVTYYEVNQDDITLGKVNEDDLIEIEIIRNIVTAKPEELDEKEDDEIIPVNPNTEVAGTKTWDDNKNQDGKRPTSITIRLLADGNEVDYKVVKESDNNWSWAFEKLPVYDGETKITYTIIEDEVSDYTTIIDAYNVINTHIPETTVVEGTKTWVDNNGQDSKRPESITIRLLADGHEVDHKVVTAADNNWSWSFENLPVYESGKKITYTITEDQVPDYTTKIDGYDVINTIKQQNVVNVSGTKTWQVPDGTLNTDLPDVIIKLYQNGELFKIGGEDVIAVLEDGANSYIFDGLPKYKIENGEYVVDDKGNFEEYEYTVSEEPVDGFDSVQQENDFINTIKQEKISISGTKTWYDNDNQDGRRPQSITVRLFANGNEVRNTTVTPNAEGDWLYSFDNLDKYLNGKVISYTISEDTVAGYTTQINEYDIANSHTPETIKVQGTKTWSDNNNRHGKRPSSIVIQLYKTVNGTKTSMGESYKVTLTSGADNVWQNTELTYKWENLPRYEGGNLITYTVEENVLTDYTPTYTRTTATNGDVTANITNTYSQDITGSIVTIKEAETPLDVVFVLDISSSMLEKDGKTKNRAQYMVEATNKAIKELMKNESNRVSVVLFNSYVYTLSDLAHYSTTGDYITYTSVTNNNNVGGKINFINGSSQNISTSYYGNGNKNNGAFKCGTYTQGGIKTATQIFEQSKDSSGNRKPVMILLTDGDPTHYDLKTTYNEHGTKYPTVGEGIAKLRYITAEYYAYTMKTMANCKKAIKSFYNRQCEVYTVGINMKGAMAKALLEPTTGNIEDLINTTNVSDEIHNSTDTGKQHETYSNLDENGKWLKGTEYYQYQSNRLNKLLTSNNSTKVTSNYTNKAYTESTSGQISENFDEIVNTITEKITTDITAAHYGSDRRIRLEGFNPNINQANSTKNVFSLKVIQNNVTTIIDTTDVSTTGAYIQGNLTDGYYLVLTNVTGKVNVQLTYRRQN